MITFSNQNDGLAAVSRGLHIAVIKKSSSSLELLHTIECDEKVESMTFANDSDRLVILTTSKVLSVWSLAQAKIISSRVLQRKGSSILYHNYEQVGKGSDQSTNSEQREMVLVGDKTGEVSAVSLPDLGVSMCSLLGHTTSMITDIAMSRDGRFLISSDRDEKIRVTCFPKTSLTYAYCMGHKEHIVNIEMIQSEPELLLSCSGDNTLRLWNFEEGRLLDMVELAPEDKDAEVQQCAVCPQTSTIAVLFKGYRTLELYQLNSEKKIEKLHDESSTLSSALDGSPRYIGFDPVTPAIWISFLDAPFISIFDVESAGSTKAPPKDNEKAVCFKKRAPNALSFFEEWAKSHDEIVEEVDQDESHGELKKKRVPEANWKSKLPDM